MSAARAPHDRRLAVVFCWHMHQPEYREPATNEFVLPWTYLHGTKDYVDMAAHLEAVPGARAVVNFAPVLIEQINAYVAALDRHLLDGAPLPDPLLATLAPGGIPDDDAGVRRLLAACLRANRSQLIDPYPRFRALAATADAALEGVGPVSGALLGQISVWYHLAWLGETVRRADPRVARLLAEDGDFSDAERRTLLELIAGELRSILPRYRRLAESGRVELAVSPWGHPILPLLLDVGSAREQMPDAPMPVDARYPGGEERARWHLRHARTVFEHTFGHAPAGCWPSEGAVSEAATALLGEAGFRWIATGGSVLRASLARSGLDAGATEYHERAWRLRGTGPACFFRDDELSDRIGFTYAHWHGDDAAADFIGRLEAIAARDEGDANRVVAIILDGENAWEYYPYNAYYFLNNLYTRLADHPTLRLATFSGLLAEGLAPSALPRLVTGSWVHGTLSTWIGSPAKNGAFELLCEAKRAFDAAIAHGLDGDRRAAAERELAVCEGSDWAWWFAEFNDARVVSDFDTLYRRHLKALYALIDVPSPPTLEVPLATGVGGAEQGGTMRRATEQGAHG